MLKAGALAPRLCYKVKIMKIIILVLIPLILVAVKLFARLAPTWAVVSSMEDDEFVCPNCGNRFSPRRRDLLFGRYRYYIYNQMKLRCPSCDTVDMCSPARD